MVIQTLRIIIVLITITKYVVQCVNIRKAKQLNRKKPNIAFDKLANYYEKILIKTIQCRIYLLTK